MRKQFGKMKSYLLLLCMHQATLISLYFKPKCKCRNELTVTHIYFFLVLNFYNLTPILQWKSQFIFVSLRA